MDANAFVRRWVTIIDASTPPWHEQMPLGAGFEIAKDSGGVYWFRPSPELKAPMNKPRKLDVSADGHGEFDVGKPLDGSLNADFGGDVGVISFTLNLVGRRCYVLSLTSGYPGGGDFGVLSHGGTHSVED